MTREKTDKTENGATGGLILEPEVRAGIDAVGELLRTHNLSVFVFPQIATGNIFWLTRQPDEKPLAKGRTLVEALENAEVLSHAD